MAWSFRSDLPIYSQLVDRIKRMIVSGALPPGARLPSVRELAAEAGVNPNTVQRALAELEREGLVFSQRTAGRYVTEDWEIIEKTRKDLAEGQIRSFLETMKELGYEGDGLIAALKEEE